MIDASALILRDGLLLVAWGTAVYLVFMLLTLSQLGQKYELRKNDLLAISLPELTTLPATYVGTDTNAVPKSGAERVDATLRVSPRYEVAISLAFQGFDVASIARRCDISVGEAKLVATLAESYQGLERPPEEQYDERHTRAAA